MYATLQRCNIPAGCCYRPGSRLKNQLRDSIGVYASCNSLAHVTFNLFKGHDATLQRWEHYLTSFTAVATPLSLCFNKTGHFSNGAFFLAPDDDSKTGLLQLMKKFYAGFPAPAFGKSTQPHISIGRQLHEEQLAAAKELIPDADISFVCDSLVIRKFNEDRKQYDLYKRFYFGGNDLLSGIPE